MGWWLAGKADQIRKSWIKRFDARFWTVNFSRPMMASVVTTAADAVRVDAVFYKADDLAGLIWESEDRLNHPLLAYTEDRDYRGCVVQFRWRSQGLRALDAVDGPTLTIEGRDADGVPRSWYVRLWNYAIGTPDDALITLDFNALTGGFTLPEEADPVYAGDIDRLFISLVPPAYGPNDDPLPEAVEGSVTLTEISCTGPSSTLAAGDALLPEHDVRMANGYDDVYNVTPERIIYNVIRLGYRDIINHYVGMSHYFRLVWNNELERFLVTNENSVLNTPCAQWHEDFIRRAAVAGFDVIISLSYELFDEHAPEEWKQRAFDGSPALTGWFPPSTLLSPAHAVAMRYLQRVACAFLELSIATGGVPLFQIGEPWWWVPADGKPYIFDHAARAMYLEDALPVVDVPTVKADLNAEQIALLDRAGAMLGRSTLDLRDAVRAVAADVQTMLLFYAPQVLDSQAPELRRANMPTLWASPAFDVLQLEDYDFVTAGDVASSDRAFETVRATLNYSSEQQHYFSGFVLNAEDRPLWSRIDAAAHTAREWGVQHVFFWAYSQIIRDGFVHFREEDALVDSFHDVLFPLELGMDAMVTPGFSTTVVSTASGYEQRNASWQNARLHFDAGVGVRSEADIGLLNDFFRGRRGAAAGFLFRDPIDNSSGVEGRAPSAEDQLLGWGDGMKTRFPLVKHYGLSSDPQTRRITRPVAGSVVVSVAGEVQSGARWVLAPGGWIDFIEPPAAGSPVRAGFRFDVPVRFAEDQLSISLPAFRAGEIPRVPLIEIREA